MSDAERAGAFREAQLQSMDDFIPGTSFPQGGFGGSPNPFANEATEGDTGAFEFVENGDDTFSQVWNALDGQCYRVQPINEDELDEDETSQFRSSWADQLSTLFCWKQQGTALWRKKREAMDDYSLKTRPWDAA